jgi:hypothetical protein
MADEHALDVSVIVPVYNTMPYLTRTLDSLLAQSIGRDRLEVIAVDDGSTDGSGEELDRYAADHPDVFVVVHQPNSGGPATPCNRGLELARGRYVFFLGADDYLGEEALARLVAKADAWGSDVIFGRMVGVGGRNVDQRIFAKTRKDLDLIESDLAFALSNTKLYRRSLVVERDLHFSRDLRVGSDQPFTIDAVTHAKRVSVLADYTYYYAVKRADETNISYSTRWRQRVGDIGAVMDHVAALLEPGAQRDAFLRRHFAWELTKVLNREFPELDDPGEQAELVEAVAGLADRYLTDGVAERLGFASRLALRLARARDVDDLRAFVALEEPVKEAPLMLSGDRVYAVLPGFRDGSGHPDTWYDVTDRSIRKRVRKEVVVRRPRLDEHTLTVSGTVPFTADSADHLRLSLVRLEDKVVPKARRRERGRIEPGHDFPVTLTARGAGEPTALTGDVDLRALLDEEAPDDARWAVRLRADAGPWTYDVPVSYKRGPLTTEAAKGRRRATFTARRAKRGYLFVEREMLPAELGRRVLRRALNRS